MSVGRREALFRVHVVYFGVFWVRGGLAHLYILARQLGRVVKAVD